MAELLLVHPKLVLIATPSQKLTLTLGIPYTSCKGKRTNRNNLLFLMERNVFEKGKTAGDMLPPFYKLVTSMSLSQIALAQLNV